MAAVSVMSRRSSRSLLVALVLAALACARSARADPVRAGDVMRIESRIDLAAFEQTFIARYNVGLFQAVVADIDRDGDGDVLATTDDGLSVWVNDGEGQLTSQPPLRQAPIDDLQAGSAWDRPTRQVDDTIQNVAPTPRLPTTRSPSPPPLLNIATVVLDRARPTDRACGLTLSRAPPLAR
jgi:hypothetical protein